MVNFWRRCLSLMRWIHGIGRARGYSTGRRNHRILCLAEESSNNRSLRKRSLLAHCPSMTFQLIE
jgi:hypothetical protein